MILVDPGHPASSSVDLCKRSWSKTREGGGHHVIHYRCRKLALDFLKSYILPTKQRKRKISTVLTSRHIPNDKYNIPNLSTINTKYTTNSKARQEEILKKTTKKLYAQTLPNKKETKRNENTYDIYIGYTTSTSPADIYFHYSSSPFPKRGSKSFEATEVYTV